MEVEDTGKLASFTMMLAAEEDSVPGHKNDAMKYFDNYEPTRGRGWILSRMMVMLGHCLMVLVKALGPTVAAEVLLVAFNAEVNREEEEPRYDA